MESTEEFINQWLDRAIGEFDTNPVCSKLIRRLAQESPETFVRSALRRLGVPDQSAALHLLTALILRDSAVFEFLARPGATTYEPSRCVLCRLMSIEPTYDIKVAKQLPDRNGSNHHTAMKGARGARLIELLDDVSPGRRLVPLLAHLAQSHDPLLRQRATLFVGRRTPSLVIGGKPLEQGDLLVPANAAAPANDLAKAAVAGTDIASEAQNAEPQEAAHPVVEETIPAPRPEPAFALRLDGSSFRSAQRPG
jgi:hypothetical protein